MTNHVHLLLSPSEEIAGLGRLMKGLAARATRYRNKLEGRTGTLWESRYKSSPVQTDQYLLACCQYIELNPVRARMIKDPGEYLWSSYRQRMGIEVDDWIDYDPCYLKRGMTDSDCRHHSKQFADQGISSKEIRLIRQVVLQRGQLTGSDRFVDEVEKILGRRVEFRAQGRPATAVGVDK